MEEVTKLLVRHYDLQIIIYFMSMGILMAMNQLYLYDIEVGFYYLKLLSVIFSHFHTFGLRPRTD